MSWRTEEIILRNRDGDKGMRGFIAEIAEYGIVNARERIKRQSDIYIWKNDMGKTNNLNSIKIVKFFVKILQLVAFPLL